MKKFPRMRAALIVFFHFILKSVGSVWLLACCYLFRLFKKKKKRKSLTIIVCHGHISLLLFDVHPLHSSTLPRELMMRSWSPLFEEACWEKWKQKEVLFKSQPPLSFQKEKEFILDMWVSGDISDHGDPSWFCYFEQNI